MTLRSTLLYALGNAKIIPFLPDPDLVLTNIPFQKGRRRVNKKYCYDDNPFLALNNQDLQSLKGLTPLDPKDSADLLMAEEFIITGEIFYI